MFLVAADGQRILGVPVGEVKEPPGLAPNAVLLAAGPEMYQLLERIVEGPIDINRVDEWDALKARIDGSAHD